MNLSPASGHLGLSAVDLGGELVGQLLFVLQVVLNPVPQRLDLVPRQNSNRLLDFLQCAHGDTLRESPAEFKTEAAVSCRQHKDHPE